jgi:predicted Zn-dependent peptidase
MQKPAGRGENEKFIKWVLVFEGMKEEKFIRRTLKNGITVLMEKRELPVVAFSITNKYGAGLESSKIKGISHFIEHLVFTGTKNRTYEEISKEIEKRGGILNAFTAHEVTSFWFKLPSEHVFVGLDILSDMLINPLFDKVKFEKEKKVILEEIKMYHDNPQRFIHDKIEENLYEKPFGEGVIGSEETISAMDRDFVFKHFREHYYPENYVVTIVGDADFDKVCEYLENNFSKSGKKTDDISPKKRNVNSIEVRASIDQAHFIFGMHAPLPATKESYALEVLDAYLANGMSSKLFIEIREKRGLAYAVRSSLNAEKDYSYYTIYVGTTKEAIPEVKKLILEGFENVKKMTEKDLQESKERLIGLKKISAEESSSVMSDLIFNEVASRAEAYYAYEENVRKVTLADVKKMAKVKKFSTAVIRPK